MVPSPVSSPCLPLTLQADSTVFVGGLSPKATEDGLQRFLSAQVGAVTSVKIILDHDTGRSKGYGFVTFHDAQLALDVRQRTDLVFLGKALNFGEAYRKTPPTAPAQPRVPQARRTPPRYAPPLAPMPHMPPYAWPYYPPYPEPWEGGYVWVPAPVPFMPYAAPFPPWLEQGGNGGNEELPRDDAQEGAERGTTQEQTEEQREAPPNTASNE